MSVVLLSPLSPSRVTWLLLTGRGTRSVETCLGRGQLLPGRLRCINWFMAGVADAGLRKRVRTRCNQAAGRVIIVSMALLVEAYIRFLVPGDMNEEVRGILR